MTTQTRPAMHPQGCQFQHGESTSQQTTHWPMPNNRGKNETNHHDFSSSGHHRLCFEPDHHDKDTRSGHKDQTRMDHGPGGCADGQAGRRRGKWRCANQHVQHYQITQFGQMCSTRSGSTHHHGLELGLVFQQAASLPSHVPRWRGDES